MPSPGRASHRRKKQEPPKNGGFFTFIESPMQKLTEEQASMLTEGVSVLSIELWPLFAHALNVAYPEWVWTLGEDGWYKTIECKPADGERKQAA